MSFLQREADAADFVRSRFDETIQQDASAFDVADRHLQQVAHDEALSWAIDAPLGLRPPLPVDRKVRCEHISVLDTVLAQSLPQGGDQLAVLRRDQRRRRPVGGDAQFGDGEIRPGTHRTRTAHGDVTSLKHVHGRCGKGQKQQA